MPTRDVPAGAAPCNFSLTDPPVVRGSWNTPSRLCLSLSQRHSEDSLLAAARAVVAHRPPHRLAARKERQGTVDGLPPADDIQLSLWMKR